jgi:hypothetical protein
VGQECLLSDLHWGGSAELAAVAALNQTYVLQGLFCLLVLGIMGLRAKRQSQGCMLWAPEEEHSYKCTLILESHCTSFLINKKVKTAVGTQTLQLSGYGNKPPFRTTSNTGHLAADWDPLN